jgi:hypothetical protein
MNITNCKKALECGKESNCVECPKFEPDFVAEVSVLNKLSMSIKFKDLDTKMVINGVDTKDLLEQILRYHSLVKAKVVPQVDNMTVNIGNESILLDINNL